MLRTDPEALFRDLENMRHDESRLRSQGLTDEFGTPVFKVFFPEAIDKCELSIPTDAPIIPPDQTPHTSAFNQLVARLVTGGKADDALKKVLDNPPHVLRTEFDGRGLGSPYCAIPDFINYIF